VYDAAGNVIETREHTDSDNPSPLMSRFYPIAFLAGASNLIPNEDCAQYYLALRKSPAGDDLTDGDLVNIAPLQLGQDVLWIHSARVREALLTGAILVGRARLEKRASYDGRCLMRTSNSTC
jgi:hypothetical protein